MSTGEGGNQKARKEQKQAHEKGHGLLKKFEKN